MKLLTLCHHMQPCAEFFKVAFYTAGWFKLHLERRSWDLEIDWDGIVRLLSLLTQMYYKSTNTDAAHPQMPFLGILPRVCVGEEMGT